MSEFLHHVVANREYIQRDMAWLSESGEHDPWESSTPIPYTFTSRLELIDDIIGRQLMERDNNG
jgi:hypothetical protein